MKNLTVSTLFLVALLLILPGHNAGAQAHAETRRVVSKVIPQYPELARPLHLQGSVRADVLVAPTGKVVSVEVRGGHPLLGQAAQDAVRQWTWEPSAHQTHETIELSFTP